MKVTKEFIDKNFSAIHLSFLQIVVFRQSLINKLLGGPVDSCIIQIVCWHHLTSLLSDNLKNQDDIQRAFKLAKQDEEARKINNDWLSSFKQLKNM